MKPVAAIALASTLACAACATAPETPPMPANYAAVPTQAPTPNAQLYAACLEQAASAGAYRRTDDGRGAEFILFTCTGAPAAASFPHGFRGEYFTDATLTTSKGVRVDPFVAFGAGNFTNPAATSGATPFGVRWTASLTPRYSETYTFTTVAGDGMRLRVNGTLVIDDWTSHATATRTGTITLVAGQPAALEIEHYNAAGDGVVAKVLWKSASQVEQVIPASVLTP
jgi:hypothetical protein